MPVYTFKDQSGQPFEINAPAGTTESQAYEYFQKQAKAGTVARVTAPAYDAAADTSGPDKVLANLGAGMDNLWQGAKGLFGKGMSDAELTDKRKRDAALADATPFGGVIQTAGEILPTLAVPAGGFVKGAQGALNLARILRGAEPVAASVAGRLGTGAAIADSSIAGGVLGALEPTTSDESRAGNVVKGVGGGALLPGVVAGTRAGARYVTNKGAADRAAQEIIDRLGGNDAASAAVADVKGYKPDAFVADIPMSVGEITQNPTLGRMERGAARDQPDKWTDLRGAQAEQRYGALRDITSDADRLPGLQELRDQATAPMRQTALGRAAKDDFFSSPVAQDVAGMLQGAGGSDPAVQKLAGYVAGELGNGITPERLYTVRKVLAEKLSGPAAIGDDLSAAAKGRQRETMSLIKSIDGALDDASGGKWTPYLERYSSESKAVNNAEAGSAIRDVFDREGSPKVSYSGVTVPEVTGARLGRSIDNEGANAFGDKLDYGTRDALGALMANIQRSEGLQKLLTKTGTSGGGSNTAMDLGQELMSSMAKSRIPGVNAVTKWSNDRAKAALSDALQNPDLFVKGVEAKLSTGKPLTDSEEGVLMLLRGATGAIATQQSP